jgi:hypothetical protein
MVEEQVAAARMRLAYKIANGPAYGLADQVEADRQAAIERESWQVEHRMIWDEVRACPKCERGSGGPDGPAWLHCENHLAQLSEHAAYRPY